MFGSFVPDPVGFFEPPLRQEPPLTTPPPFPKTRKLALDTVGGAGAGSYGACEYTHYLKCRLYIMYQFRLHL